MLRVINGISIDYPRGSLLTRRDEDEMKDEGKEEEEGESVM
jgi:hypothetical protein